MNNYNLNKFDDERFSHFSNDDDKSRALTPPESTSIDPEYMLQVRGALLQADLASSRSTHGLVGANQRDSPSDDVVLRLALLASDWSERSGSPVNEFFNPADPLHKSALDLFND